MTTTRKYRRMTVSFDVLMLAPESEGLDGNFINYDDEENPTHESFTITDDEYEDILADMSDSRFRESTCRVFKRNVEEGEDLGDNQGQSAFLATICERFFISEITIHQPTEYEE